jgi:hypothetical protein
MLFDFSKMGSSQRDVENMKTSVSELTNGKRQASMAPYDTDGDGNLDPLEKAMKQYDTDKSGTFSAAEVKLIVRRLSSLVHAPGGRAPKLRVEQEASQSPAGQ